MLWLWLWVARKLLLPVMNPQLPARIVLSKRFLLLTIFSGIASTQVSVMFVTYPDHLTRSLPGVDGIRPFLRLPVSSCCCRWDAFVASRRRCVAMLLRSCFFFVRLSLRQLGVLAKHYGGEDSVASGLRFMEVFVAAAER